MTNKLNQGDAMLDIKKALYNDPVCKKYLESELNIIPIADGDNKTMSNKLTDNQQYMVNQFEKLDTVDWYKLKLKDGEGNETHYFNITAKELDVIKQMLVGA